MGIGLIPPRSRGGRSDDLENGPVVRVGERPPIAGWAPVRPSCRPRPVGYHLFTDGSNGGSLGGVEDSKLLDTLEVVLVLPAPGSVWIDPNIESPVGRVEPSGPHAERRLQVHVPAEECPVGVPEQLDRVLVALTH